MFVDTLILHTEWIYVWNFMNRMVKVGYKHDIKSIWIWIGRLNNKHDHVKLEIRVDIV